MTASAIVASFFAFSSSRKAVASFIATFKSAISFERPASSSVICAIEAVISSTAAVRSAISAESLSRVILFWPNSVSQKPFCSDRVCLFHQLLDQVPNHLLNLLEGIRGGLDLLCEESEPLAVDTLALGEEE